VLFIARPVEAGRAAIALPCDCRTSAAVFDASGRLVRTLWSGRSEPRGSIEISWDGRDDEGTSVHGGRYFARVLFNQVRYVWDGVIGNTSRDTVGAHFHRALAPISDMAIDGRGDAFYVVGYNEQQNAINRFEVSDPQARTALAADDYRRVFKYACTDGTLAYFANVGLLAPSGSPMRDPATFVVALRVSDGREYHFAEGRVVVPDLTRPGANRWESAIDYADENQERGGGFNQAPSGLAVQQRGKLLFVSHESLNEVHILDKSTGAPAGTIRLFAPAAIATAPDDSLWVIARPPGGPVLVHLALRGREWVPITEVRDGLEAPNALGISPLDGTVLVADSERQQLLAFDEHGRARWRFGLEGGYRHGDPDVSTDRFWFMPGETYIAFQPDGSFWVGDPGNARNLHFAASRRYLDQIMYLPKSYVVAVDPADPTRVFNQYLEFTVDYSKPLRNSWRLVRNWGAGLDSSYFYDMAGLRTVVTLRNGRTYGVVSQRDSRFKELEELTGRGLRATGTKLEYGERLYPDGSRRQFVERLDDVAVYSRTLSGFDAANNPQWNAPEMLARVSGVQPRDPYYHDAPSTIANEPTFPVTSSGMLVFFNPGRSPGYHLGGVRAAGNTWSWRASPSGHWMLDRAGAVTSLDGTYELGRGVQYLGSIPLTSGRNIIYGYHGEAWNGGQADQWMHFYDDGLFVGQFGVPVYASQNKNSAPAGSAGNAFSPQLAAVNGELYLWHNDESVHAGVHRWHIEGANRIRELEVPIEP
jgi:FlgD Ig-like domain